MCQQYLNFLAAICISSTILYRNRMQAQQKVSHKRNREKKTRKMQRPYRTEKAIVEEMLDLLDERCRVDLEDAIKTEHDAIAT